MVVQELLGFIEKFPLNNPENLVLLVEDLKETPVSIQAKILPRLILSGFGLGFVDRIKVFFLRTFLYERTATAFEQSLRKNQNSCKLIWDSTLESILKQNISQSDMIVFYGLILSNGYSPSEELLCRI